VADAGADVKEPQAVAEAGEEKGGEKDPASGSAVRAMAATRLLQNVVGETLAKGPTHD